jgi:2-oxoglutarate dehydrogenase E2 component (dihydrolipoamide succinyltransferase)
MAIELKVPVVGESITEVQISEWLKAEGDSVQKDEPVVVIDSEKTTFELPAPEAGTLTKIFCKAGDTVSIGTVLAELEPGAAAMPRPEKAKPAPAPAAKPAPAPAAKAPPPSAAKAPPASATRPAPAPATKPVPASATPAPAEPAAETQLPRPPSTPTAPPALPRAPLKTSTESEEEVVPMTRLRRTIARRLVEALHTMAMVTTFNEIDMSAVQALRAQHQETFQRRHGVKLGLMSFFVKAAIEALKQFPQLNAEVRGDDIVYRNYFDIGVAIATERGLVVPVLRRAERLSFAEVEKEIASFAQRAKENALNPEDLEGGTFTVTNGGVFGSLLSAPLINPPQSGILGLHAIEDRPVAREGSVVIRPMMYVALTYDHRIVDGREAVLFLRRVKELAENPVRMLVEV